MWEDPIVADVHQNREKLAARYNFDAGAFFAAVRRRQVALGERLVKQEQPAVEADADRPSGSRESASFEAVPERLKLP